MLTILIGLFTTIYLIINLYKKDLDLFSIAIIAIFAVSSTLTLGIESPLSGYNEWELLEKTDLVQYSDSTLSEYCVIVADEETFGEVEIQEDPKCTEPVLLKFEKTAKRTIWTFGLNRKTKFVLYVPEGFQMKKLNIE